MKKNSNLRKIRGKADRSGKIIYKGKSVAVKKDGTPYKHNYFTSGSKTKLVLEHLQSGKTLSQLQCYPPSKFNTIRLGAIIGELRERGHKINMKMKYNSRTGSKHGVYSMDI
jgi:hypothetical protein